MAKEVFKIGSVVLVLPAPGERLPGIGTVEALVQTVIGTQYRVRLSGGASVETPLVFTDLVRLQRTLKKNGPASTATGADAAHAAGNIAGSPLTTPHKTSATPAEPRTVKPEMHRSR